MTEWRRLVKKTFKPIAIKLQLATKRNPDAYKIIGAVSGLGEKRVREIAEGADPTFIEERTLEVLAEN
jgi:hypothetical protein